MFISGYLVEHTYDGILFSCTKSEILISATAWMILTNSMLSNRSQTHDITECIMSFIWTVPNR